MAEKERKWPKNTAKNFSRSTRQYIITDIILSRYSWDFWNTWSIGRLAILYYNRLPMKLVLLIVSKQVLTW